MNPIQYTPFQISLEQSPWINQDPRMCQAFQIYNNIKGGNALIHKTTRAGCTTALIAGSINLKEKFLCVVPTNHIADKTVVADSIKYSDVHNATVIHIPANHECLINKQMCDLCPDLAQLPILPLAGSCKKCAQEKECPVTAVTRKPDASGIVVTYKKLAALMLAAGARPNVPTVAANILEILELTKNIVLDEVHDIQFGEHTDFIVYDDHVFNRVNLEKYASLLHLFPYARRVVTQFSFIMKEQQVKNCMMEVLGGAQDESYWKHHLTKSIKNPSPGIVDGENAANVIVGTYNEIIDLTKDRIKYNLEMEDILDIYKMMNIVMSDVISINAIRDNGVIKINLSAVDKATVRMIQSYTMRMQSADRRIFLTSATIGSYDYGQMFMGGVKPRKITFGLGGDPMNSNSKMLILADSKKYHVIGRNATYNKKDEIVSRIIEILDRWGDDDCIIIALNTTEASKLKTALSSVGHPHNVTYYKAPEMMGVSADARVMIAIGIANKPSNSFDVVTTNVVDSKRMLFESVHCDTWQAWSRIKDPECKVPSLVFGLGCTVEECEALTTWGYDRSLEISPYVERQKKKVNVNCEKGVISRPLVMKCKSFDDMLTEGSMHKLCKLSPKNHENLLIYYNIRRFCEKTGKTLRSGEDLIKLVLNRPDAYGMQNTDGRYFTVKNPVSDSIIKRHLEGSLTIGAYQFDSENLVKWVCFDIDSHAPENVIESETDIKMRDEQAERDTEKMCNFLTVSDIPYMLEKSGSPHSYHIWLFVNPVSGKIAKQFGIDIKKETGIDCEVFPKQSHIGKDGYGNLVKIPLATHKKYGTKSEIMDRKSGLFVRNFENLEIEILDLSAYPMPEMKEVVKVCSETPEKTVVPFSRGPERDVRPCIKASLGKQLRGTQGHFMRIAICREYHNSGIFDPEQLVNLYKGQNDFSHAESMKGVMSIISKDSKNVRCDRLRVDGSNFVNCEGCGYLGRW